MSWSSSSMRMLNRCSNATSTTAVSVHCSVRGSCGVRPRFVSSAQRMSSSRMRLARITNTATTATLMSSVTPQPLQQQRQPVAGVPSHRQLFYSDTTPVHNKNNQHNSALADSSQKSSSSSSSSHSSSADSLDLESDYESEDVDPVQYVSPIQDFWDSLAANHTTLLGAEAAVPGCDPRKLTGDRNIPNLTLKCGIPVSALKFKTTSYGRLIHAPYVHAKEHQVIVKVNVSKLPLDEMEKEILREIVGKRLNDKRGELRMQSDQFGSRIENKRHLVSMLDRIILSCQRLGRELQQQSINNSNSSNDKDNSNDSNSSNDINTDSDSNNISDNNDNNDKNEIDQAEEPSPTLSSTSSLPS